MSAELAAAARAGLLAGDLEPLAPYLRSFGDDTLALVADLIEGTGPVAGYRIGIEAGRAAQQVRTTAPPAASVLHGLLSNASVLAEQRAAQIRETDQYRSKRFPAWGDYAATAGFHSYASATRMVLAPKEAPTRRGEPKLNRPNTVEVPAAGEQSIAPPAQTNHGAAAQEDISQVVRDAFMRAQEQRKSR